MLKNRRKNLGIKQRDLAKKLGISQGHWSKIENNKVNNVNIEFITKLSKELHLDPVEVFYYFYNSYTKSNLK